LIIIFDHLSYLENYEHFLFRLWLTFVIKCIWVNCTYQTTICQVGADWSNYF
jgi:hypothetical protein